MPKSISAAMQNHLNQEVTSLATCWRVTRTDGREFFFTDHDVDITFDGNTYLAETGYRRTSIQNDATLAVDNLDIEGIFDSDQITEEDLRAGLFDYARIRVFIVNWADISDGDIKMRSGRLGEVILTEQGVFRSELRGLSQALSQTIGEVYQPECRADLGDNRCKVPIQPPVRANSTEYALGNYIRVATATSTIPPTIRLLVPADTNADAVGFFPSTATLGTQATVQTVVSQFGAGSIEFSPVGSAQNSQAFVSYADSDNFTLSNFQFTIEGWVRFKDLTESRQILASHYLNTGNQRAWFIQRNGDAFEAIFFEDGDASQFTITSNPVGWQIDTWYHFAVTREGDVFRVFVNGQLLGAQTVTAGRPVFDSAAPLQLGKFSATGFPEFPLNGFIDDFRFTIGRAFYTVPFNPPTQAFPTVASQVNQDAYANRIYECVQAGTSSLSEPVYNTTVGAITTDGTAVFAAREAWTRHAFVGTVTDRRTFTIEGFVEGRANDDYFNGGAMTFEDGDNAGRTIEIRDWAFINRTITLFIPPGFPVVSGTAVRLYPGCDKRRETCVNKFRIPDTLDFDNGNIRNYRGEPFIPGTDSITSYPDAQ